MLLKPWPGFTIKTRPMSHGSTGEAAARGGALFGIRRPFDSTADRLESPSLEVATRSQQTGNRVGSGQTTSSDAIEAGVVAASIAAPP